jgi:dGTP triphosphohydrolase
MRKKAASFEDLNEQAKNKQDDGFGMEGMDMAAIQKMMQGADMDQLQKLWTEALKDPAAMKQMEAMGGKFTEAIEEMAKMTPEQLMSQMQEAMQMLTDDSMADKIVQQKDEVLKSLEQSGMVTPEELARFKTDPAYFESKMRESFNQMKGIFSDPEAIKSAMNAMASGGEGMMTEMAKMFSEGLDSDEKIEEARLEVLKNPELMDNPMLKPMFDTPEFKELIKDPKKWRESIKEGQKAFAGGLGQGAGVGEL